MKGDISIDLIHINYSIPQNVLFILIKYNCLHNIYATGNIRYRCHNLISHLCMHTCCTVFCVSTVKSHHEAINIVFAMWRMLLPVESVFNSSNLKEISVIPGTKARRKKRLLIYFHSLKRSVFCDTVKLRIGHNFICCHRNVCLNVYGHLTCVFIRKLNGIYSVQCYNLNWLRYELEVPFWEERCCPSLFRCISYILILVLRSAYSSSMMDGFYIFGCGMDNNMIALETVEHGWYLELYDEWMGERTQCGSKISWICCVLGIEINS